MAFDKTLTLIDLELRLTVTQRDLSHLSAEEQFCLLKSRAVHCVKEPELRERLHNSKKSGHPLRVKYGIDPTAADIHLGHVVSVIIARRLLQMGHHIILLIGDFTAFVGDPTGRVRTRPILTEEQIRANAASYTDQIGKFIDLSRVEIAYNSPHYTNMEILDLFRLYRSNRLAPLLQREDFRNRAEGLTIAEALYPTLMAIDSIRLQPDIELGGNDQLLNFQTCAQFMDSIGLPPESALTTELLQGTAGDGQKMSKSLNNYIALNAPADEAYGKLLSIPDYLIEHYFKLLTDITDADWFALREAMDEQSLNPKLVKQLLARVVVTFLHSAEQARVEEQRFEAIFSKGRPPDDIPEFNIGTTSATTWTDLLLFCGFVKSRNEAHRLIRSGAVRYLLSDETFKVIDPNGSFPPDPSWVLNVGKRRFARLRNPSADDSNEVED